MRDWEQGLSPIARERLARIGELTQEEQERMLDTQTVNSILSDFYRGQIDPESLWKRLKEEGKPSLLREAQMTLVDSLNLGITPAELQKIRDGILAIESLKKEQNTSVIELNLNRTEDLQKKHRAEIEQAYAAIRAEVEGNPRLRMKQVQQGQKNMVVQLTVDEAIRQLPQWQEFLSSQEKRYNQEYSKIIERLKKELK
jgi:hypothetical protein